MTYQEAKEFIKGQLLFFKFSDIDGSEAYVKVYPVLLEYIDTLEKQIAEKEARNLINLNKNIESE